MLTFAQNSLEVVAGASSATPLNFDNQTDSTVEIALNVKFLNFPPELVQQSSWIPGKLSGSINRGAKIDFETEKTVTIVIEDSCRQTLEISLKEEAPVGDYKIRVTSSVPSCKDAQSQPTTIFNLTVRHKDCQPYRNLPVNTITGTLPGTPSPPPPEYYFVFAPRSLYDAVESCLQGSEEFHLRHTLDEESLTLAYSIGNVICRTWVVDHPQSLLGRGDSLVKQFKSYEQQQTDCKGCNVLTIIVGDPVDLVLHLRADIYLAVALWLLEHKRAADDGTVKNICNALLASKNNTCKHDGNLFFRLERQPSVSKLLKEILPSSLGLKNHFIFCGHGDSDGCFCLSEKEVIYGNEMSRVLSASSRNVLFNCCFAERISLSFAAGFGEDSFNLCRDLLAKSLDPETVDVNNVQGDGKVSQGNKDRLEEARELVESFLYEEFAPFMTDEVEADDGVDDQEEEEQSIQNGPRPIRGVPQAPPQWMTADDFTSIDPSAGEASSVNTTLSDVQEQTQQQEMFDVVDQRVAKFKNLALYGNNARSGINPLGFGTIPGVGALGYLLSVHENNTASSDETVCCCCLHWSGSGPVSKQKWIRRAQAWARAHPTLSSLSSSTELKQAAARASSWKMPSQQPDVSSLAKHSFKTNMTITTFNVGDGDCSFVTLPGNHPKDTKFILIDGGRDYNTDDWWPIVGACPRIAKLFVSHSDFDHTGGIVKYVTEMNSLRAEKKITNLAAYPAVPVTSYLWAKGVSSKMYDVRNLDHAKEIFDGLKKRNSLPKYPVRGSKLSCGPCTTIYVLNPTESQVDAATDKGASVKVNTASIVLLVAYNDGSNKSTALFTADAFENDIIEGLLHCRQKFKAEWPWKDWTCDETPLPDDTLLWRKKNALILATLVLSLRSTTWTCLIMVLFTTRAPLSSSMSKRKLTFKVPRVVIPDTRRRWPGEPS